MCKLIEAYKTSDGTIFEDEMMTIISGTTYRTECGRGRAKYNPEWGRSKPWLVYRNGAATNSFATLEECCTYFKSYEMTLKTEWEN